MAEVKPSKITENTAARDRVLDAARRWLSKPRKGLHVSDLLYPRKAYFRRKIPEAPLSERKIGYFVAGRAHHGIIEALAALPEYREVRVGWQDIHGTIDVFQGLPIEIKSTRSKFADSIDELRRRHPIWFEQLGFYGALTGSSKGQLWIFYLSVQVQPDSKRTAPKIVVYDVEFDDLDAIRAEMLHRKRLLEEALATNDPSHLRPCPGWMCSGCEYREHCRPKRETSEKPSPGKPAEITITVQGEKSRAEEGIGGGPQ